MSGSTLQRLGDPLSENVKDVDGDGQAMTFTYLDENGNTITGAPSTIRTDA